MNSSLLPVSLSLQLRQIQNLIITNFDLLCMGISSLIAHEILEGQDHMVFTLVISVSNMGFSALTFNLHFISE